MPRATSKSKSAIKASGFASWFDLERSYIIFALIYFPVAILFLKQGTLETALLAVYTAIMALVGIVLIAKFLLHLAAAANERDGKFGSLYAMYIFDVLVPLLMAKVLGYVLIQILPKVHSGLLCTLKDFIWDLYFYVFNFQHVMSVLIVASFTVMSLVALWSVGIWPSKK